jgi:hypothetical protein
MTMLARVFSGCWEGAQRVKFRSSTGAGELLPATQRQRPTERLKAAQRHRAHEAEASNPPASRVGVLFATISGISPDDAAVSILTTIAH